MPVRHGSTLSAAPRAWVRPRLWCGVICLAALSLAGCGGRAATDLLEARLRQQEDHNRELEGQLSVARQELAAVQRDADQLREQLASQGTTPILPEHAQALFRVSGIRLQKWRTGGLDTDGAPGDDVLNVWLVPYDVQGDAVKLPGEVSVSLRDGLTASRSAIATAGAVVGESGEAGETQTAARWTIAAAEMRDAWQPGPVEGGFLLRLPLQAASRLTSPILDVTLKSADGRSWTTSAPVRVSWGETVDDSVTRGSAPAVSAVRELFDEERVAGTGGLVPLPTDDPNDPVEPGPAQPSEKPARPVVRTKPVAPPDAKANKAETTRPRAARVDTSLNETEFRARTIR